MNPRPAQLLLIAIGLPVAAVAADPPPSQPPGVVNPPYHGSALGAPFPDNVYGADHGGGTLALTYPFTSPFGNLDHSRGVVTYDCAPFTPRNSEGVYGMDVWLEAENPDGSWSPAGPNGGLPDGMISPYQPVNTPNPGPSPAYAFTWTFNSLPLPPFTLYRVFVYVYLYNQGGGSQGNFYVASSLGTVSTGPANDPPLVAWSPSFGAVNPSTVTAAQSYTISAGGTDDNGNLSSVQVWKNGQPFAGAGSGDGFRASAAAASTDSPGSETYTAQATDAAGAQSPLITWTVTVMGKSDQPAVSSEDSAVELGQPFEPSYTGGAGIGGWQFVISGYTNFNGGATSDTGTEFADGSWSPSWVAPAIGTYSFWISRNGDANYNPSPPTGPYTLTVTTVPEGPAPPSTPAPTIPTTPQPPPTPSPTAPPPLAANPPPATAPAPSVPAATEYTLTTSVVGNGSVTPGGTYAGGTMVTITATPAPGARFTEWAGNAEGNINPLGVVMQSNLNIVAQFGGKYSQYLDFEPIVSTTYPGPPLQLIANADSGLPVVFDLWYGAGSIQGNTFVPTGVGEVVIQAQQPGNARYFAAAPVLRTGYVTPAPTLPASTDILRIRFDANGAQFSLHTGGSGTAGGTSSLWTDPASLLNSPWPTFQSPQPILPNSVNLPLPPPPAPPIVNQ